MCELFCLSSSWPTTVAFSLEELSRHGAVGRSTVDGWGLAYHDGRDVRLYKEPEPAGESAWLAFIRGRNLASSIVISHIRRATQGALSHANTQPFTRELAGRMHVFAHNGHIVDLTDRAEFDVPPFTPVGETDSELAFCDLMARVSSLWKGGVVPSVKGRFDIFETFCADMRARGVANFLYADGEIVFAHGHRRIQSDGRIAPPGLWRLERRCSVDADKLAAMGVDIADGPPDQQVTLLASVPLTDEAWTPMSEGETVMLKSGRVLTLAECV